MEEIIFHHVVVSIISAGFTLLLIFLIFKIFNIKQSNYRTLFIYLALIRPLLPLVFGAPSKGDLVKIRVGLKFFDPLNVIPVNLDLNYSHFIWNEKIIVLTVILVLFTIALSLIYRWTGLLILYRKLACEDELRREDCPQIFSILDELVPVFKTPYPKVVLSQKRTQGPFTIGFRRPVIVISPEIIEGLTSKQLMMVFAHELSHIKRRDYISHWVALIIRDIQFFNPFVHISYNWLSIEKEKACDELSLEKVELESKYLAKAILSVCRLNDNKPPRLPDLEYPTFFIKQMNCLEKRVLNIINYRYAKHLPTFFLIESSIAYSSFFIFLFFQLWIEKSGTILLL